MIAIHELLSEGRENARTGRELADYLDCNIRDITIQIEKERREGKPICAATTGAPGYYLASTPEELEEYCRQLKNRAIQMFKTRQALIRTLTQIRDNKEREA